MGILAKKFAVYREENLVTDPDRGRLLLFETERAAEIAADFYGGDVVHIYISIDEKFTPRRTAAEARNARREVLRAAGEVH